MDRPATLTNRDMTQQGPLGKFQTLKTQPAWRLGYATNWIDHLGRLPSIFESQPPFL